MNVLISVANYREKVGFRVIMDFQKNSLSVRRREVPFEDDFQIIIGDEEDGEALTFKRGELKKLATLINNLLNEKL